MKRVFPYLLALPFCLSPLPVMSEGTAPSQSDQIKEGFELLRDGGRELFGQWLDELGPALEEIEDFVLDLNAYEAPEILPNGDILIRRKPGAAPYNAPSNDQDAPDQDVPDQDAPDQNLKGQNPQDQEIIDL